MAAFEAEVKGYLKALKWAVELGLTHVDVETDSLLTVRHIQEGIKNILEVGMLIYECRNLLGNHMSFSVSHIRKHANKVAHLIVRVPFEVNIFLIFYSTLSVRRSFV